MMTPIFVAAWSLVGVFTVLYLVWGFAADHLARVVERRRVQVLAVLSVVLFEADDEAESIHEMVLDLPRKQLLEVVQSLAVDLDGGARARLQKLVMVMGLHKYIAKRAASRSWRVRVQAAQLQYLVTHPDFEPADLLTDRVPLVRARAAESLTAQQATRYVDLLMVLLDDNQLVVRIAAQQALIKAGSGAVPSIREHLEGDQVQVIRALEVAANMPDPRLVTVLDRHASSDDAMVRETAAKALGNGSSASSATILHRLIDDEEAPVRVMALESLGRLQSSMSAALIGAKLSDRSFQVRRAAGLALDSLGPSGRLVLRHHLEDSDRFARDMARQVLDASAARTGLAVIPPLDDPLDGLDECDRYAEIALWARQKVNGSAGGVIDTVHDRGDLSTAGRVTDEDVRTMVFLAMSAQGLAEVQAEESSR